MARTEENGTRTFIDGTVLQMVEIAQPHGLSRTGYINYLIQLGLAAEAKSHRLSNAAQVEKDFHDWAKGRRGSTQELLKQYNQEVSS